MSKLYAIYGRVGELEASFPSYAQTGFGADPSPYVISTHTTSVFEPSPLRQLKQALVTLGRSGADPLVTPEKDLIRETNWKKIDSASDVWEPALSDELVMFASRYRKWGEDELDLTPPYIRLAPNNEIGPIPTLALMRLLAAVVRLKTGGSQTLSDFERWYYENDKPPLSTYVQADAWPPSWYPTCTQPNYGWGTVPSEVAAQDAELVDTWNRIVSDEVLTEEDRTAWAPILTMIRDRRNALADRFCVSSEEAACKTSGGTWHKVIGRCITTKEQCLPPRVWRDGACYDAGAAPKPPTTPTKPVPPSSTAPSSSVIPLVAVTAAAVLGLRWYLSKRKRAL